MGKKALGNGDEWRYDHQTLRAMSSVEQPTVRATFFRATKMPAMLINSFLHAPIHANPTQSGSGALPNASAYFYVVTATTAVRRRSVPIFR